MHVHQNFAAGRGPVREEVTPWFRATFTQTLAIRVEGREPPTDPVKDMPLIAVPDPSRRVTVHVHTRRQGSGLWNA